MDARCVHLPLSTERLWLREFRDEDWRDVHAYAGDPEVVQHMQWGPNTEAQSRDFMARRLEHVLAAPRMDWELALELKSEARVIGACGIRVRSLAHRQADLGYVLNRADWGKGLVTEAAAALVEFGFKVLGMHRIWATTDPENRGSIRVLEKLGMRCEGRLRDDKLIRGAFRDRLLYALLEPEWARARARDD